MWCWCVTVISLHTIHARNEYKLTTYNIKFFNYFYCPHLIHIKHIIQAVVVLFHHFLLLFLFIFWCWFVRFFLQSFLSIKSWFVWIKTNAHMKQWRTFHRNTVTTPSLPPVISSLSYSSTMVWTVYCTSPFSIALYLPEMKLRAVEGCCMRVGSTWSIETLPLFASLGRKMSVNLCRGVIRKHLASRLYDLHI